MHYNINLLIARVLYPPSFYLNLIMSKVIKTRRWWDYIDNQLILGARPSINQARRLKDIGVKAVLNCCEEYNGPQEFYTANGISHLKLNVVDYQSPSIEQVVQGVGYIEEMINLGNKIYVHCKAGKGRSATIVLCWLIKSKKLNPESAMKFIVDKRPHVNKRIHKRDVVKRFVKHLGLH